MTRDDAQTLLETHIANPSLRNHCRMVGQAMEAYARHLGKSEEEVEHWYLAGLLHDLDWEKWPEEHPNHALQHILPQAGLPQDALNAIAAHAPERTGRTPHTEMERYLFACDEICGFLEACAKVRPEGYTGMKASSVKKKLKNRSFAAAVSRDDIDMGAQLIGTPLEQHITFLVDIFETSPLQS